MATPRVASHSVCASVARLTVNYVGETVTYSQRSMGETEYISVAETSEGIGGTESVGEEVTLPVVELLTGRGFVTGKSGSGKSNSASVIAEKLLDSGFGLLIVDIDGEYYGLKEEYEILHAGGDEECDIQVTPDHAEKLASLALEQNVPIILDVSSYLDESEAEELLTAVARRLFGKAKKEKQPFLLLVEEVHEYIPEKGSVGECGRMLIKIGKRGRKHGLGICGISQRPADVKKDFITQCDWLLWHRLTWNNDTNVVRQILDSEYADAVEELNDGEGFLVTDWSEAVRRVQFYRKKTFDAGATPGLDDFERPDLKSVSDDLVSELQDISEEQKARDDRIAELRAELDTKNSRIAELEAELQDARDLERMANQFVNAMVQHVEGPAPGRTERERMRTAATERLQASAGQAEDTHSNGDGGTEAFAAMMDAAPQLSAGPTEDAGSPADESEADDTEEDTTTATGSSTATTDAASDNDDGNERFSADRILAALRSAPDAPIHGSASDQSDEAVKLALPSTFGESSSPQNGDSPAGSDAEILDADALGDEEPLAVRELKAAIGGLETKTRKMLSFYREYGPSTPLNAHFAAGGDGDRTLAYAHNRELRTAGLIDHVGRGYYDYSVPDLLEEELGVRVSETDISAFTNTIEEQFLDA